MAAAFRDSAKADFKQVVDAALSKLRDELLSQFSAALSDLQAENEQLRRRIDEAESRRQPSVSPSTDEEQDDREERERAEAEPERAPRPPTPPPAARPPDRDRRADSRTRDRSIRRSPARRHDGHRSSRGSPRSEERSRSPLERRQPPAPARSLSRTRGPKGSGKGKDGSTLCFLYLVGKCTKNQCPDRHPSREESKALLDKMQSTSCKWGLDCKRRDCVFWHPAGRGFG